MRSIIMRNKESVINLLLRGSSWSNGFLIANVQRRRVTLRSSLPETSWYRHPSYHSSVPRSRSTIESTLYLLLRFPSCVPCLALCSIVAPHRSHGDNKGTILSPIPRRYLLYLSIGHSWKETGRPARIPPSSNGKSYDRRSGQDPRSTPDLSKGTSWRLDADSTGHGPRLIPRRSTVKWRGETNETRREGGRKRRRRRRRSGRRGKKRKKYTRKAEAERRNKLTEQTAGKPGSRCREEGEVVVSQLVLTRMARGEETTKKTTTNDHEQHVGRPFFSTLLRRAPVMQIRGGSRRCVPRIVAWLLGRCPHGRVEGARARELCGIV